MSRLKKKAHSEDLDMDEHLARLKAEAEDERRRVYMERFGTLPEFKEKERLMSQDDFN